MSKIFIPANSPEDWRLLLAKPDKQWRIGYSAKALADCWEQEDNFPPDVRRVFRKSGIRLSKDIEMLLAFPEYIVP